jgi:hypothetical protein
MRKYLYVVLLLLTSALLWAEELRLLGSIKDGQYISPTGNLILALPFSQNKVGDNIIRDEVNLTTLNIYMHDKASNMHHRIELSYIHDKNISDTIEKLVFQYQNLMNRVNPGTAQLIHFDRIGSSKRYLYKQAGNGVVRYHYIQIARHEKRLLLIWSDFIQTEPDTPENEDLIIEGNHNNIKIAQQLFLSANHQQ